MESEELEVPQNHEKEIGSAKGQKGDSASSVSTSSASPPASPTKHSPPSSQQLKRNSYHTQGELNGDGREYSNHSEPSSPQSKSPLSGISAPRIPNIKIKKQYSKIYRIKTKILQNLGKADKTTDEVFDEYEANFNRQQQNANRLHREISNYLRCARALHGASKSLFETLSEVYEPEWVGHELIYAQAQNSDMLWTDFCHKIHDQTLVPLTAYTQEFPEIRKKIDKRGRKLVDYDSQRHQLENLQRSNRRDEYKIARVKDQLENARSTYETLNKELYDELPSIYDQRIPNSANSLQTLFAAEGTFMQESSKISKELDLIAEKLGKECLKGTYNTKRGFPPKAPKAITAEGSPQQSPRTQNSPTVWYEVTDADAAAAPSSLNSKSLPSASPKETMEEDDSPFSSIKEEKKGGDILKEGEINNGKKDEIEKSEEKINLNSNSNIDTDEMFEDILKDDDVHEDDDENRISVTPPRTPPPPPVLPQASPPPPPPDSPINTDHPIETPRKNKDENRPTISGPVVGGREETGRPYEEIEFEDKKVNGTSAPKVNGEVVGTPIPPGSKNKVEDVYDIPVGATTEGLPSGVLYRVKATYKYVREDVDELGFDVGEIIDVVEYEDPEEQEEGWLCGIKESSQEKGLFPANFTRPL